MSVEKERVGKIIKVPEELQSWRREREEEMGWERASVAKKMVSVNKYAALAPYVRELVGAYHVLALLGGKYACRGEDGRGKKTLC